MADWTITLSAEEELALATRVATWQQSQPDTAWTPQLVLQTMLSSDLATELRTLDHKLQGIAGLARRMSRANFLPMIAALTGPEKTRLQYLLRDIPE